MLELRRVKTEKFGQGGKDGWRTVAWTDTFSSQGQYLLASSQSPLFFVCPFPRSLSDEIYWAALLAFDEIYTQPTGEVPLVGMGSFQIERLEGGLT